MPHKLQALLPTRLLHLSAGPVWSNQHVGRRMALSENVEHLGGKEAASVDIIFKKGSACVKTLKNEADNTRIKIREHGQTMVSTKDRESR